MASQTAFQGIPRSAAIVDGGDGSKALAFNITGFTTSTTRTWVFPNTSGTVVDLDSAQVLENKKLRTDTSGFADASDTTKVLLFDISGFTAATSRTWIVPNVADTFVGLAATQNLTNKTLTAPVLSGNTTSSGNISTTGQVIETNFATAGTTTYVAAQHTDNTNAASHAKCYLAVGGTSGGDAFVEYAGAANGWSAGVDTSASAVYKISVNGNPSAGTARLSLTVNGGVVCGAAAIATNATDGFLYIPSCAGAATGTPVEQTGRVPIVFDTTNGRLYAYYGGAWKYQSVAT